MSLFLLYIESSIGTYSTVDLVIKVFPVGSVIHKYALQVQLPESRENKLPSHLDERLFSQYEAVVTTQRYLAKRAFTGIGETFLAMVSAATLCRYNRNESHTVRLNPNKSFTHMHMSIS